MNLVLNVLRSYWLRSGSSGKSDLTFGIWLFATDKLWDTHRWSGIQTLFGHGFRFLSIANIIHYRFYSRSGQFWSFTNLIFSRVSSQMSSLYFVFELDLRVSLISGWYSHVDAFFLIDITTKLFFTDLISNVLRSIRFWSESGPSRKSNLPLMFSCWSIYR